TDADLCTQLILMLCNPFFLSWSAERYKEYIRARRLYRLHNIRFFLLREISIAATCHLQLRITLSYPCSCSLWNPRPPPQKIKAYPPLLCRSTQKRKHIGPIDIFANILVQ